MITDTWNKASLLDLEEETGRRLGANSHEFFVTSYHHDPLCWERVREATISAIRRHSERKGMSLDEPKYKVQFDEPKYEVQFDASDNWWVVVASVRPIAAATSITD